MCAAINIQEIGLVSGGSAIGIELYGFTEGDQITLDFYNDRRDDSPLAKEGRVAQTFGSITGTVKLLTARLGLEKQFTLENPTLKGNTTQTKMALGVRFPQPDESLASVDLYLPDDQANVNEGDTFEIYIVSDAEDGVRSPTTILANTRRALWPSDSNPISTYSYHQYNAVQFYTNECDDPAGTSGYFHDMVDAIRQAKDFIFIVDWSFHAYMRPLRSGGYDIQDTIGAILITQALAHPDMLIAIHTWDHINMAMPDAPNDAGDDELDLIARVGFADRGLSKRPKNLLWRRSSRTGIGFSHHQKFVVLDSPAAIADEPAPERVRPRVFMGGMDITKGRFDTPDHPNLPDDPAAAGYAVELSINAAFSAAEDADSMTITYDDWYNAEFYGLDACEKPPKFPRETWHDIGVTFAGPSAWDIIREFVGRWMLDPSNPIPDIVPDWLKSRLPVPFREFGDGVDTSPQVLAKFKSLFTKRQRSTVRRGSDDRPPLVYMQQWEYFGPQRWSVQICRSLKKEHWGQPTPIKIDCADYTKEEFKWKINGSFERSIQDCYLNAINQAESFIYIETQYFISSGNNWKHNSVKNAVAETLVNRAIAQSNAGKPFHIYLLIPMFPEGPPSDAGNAAQRQFQWASILSMTQTIELKTGRPYTDLMSVYFLAKWKDLGRPLSLGGDREANVKANLRYQIYIHAKYMMIDDRFLFIGSANLNERSLAGDRDSEIGAAFWPSDDAVKDDCIKQAKAFRKRILQGHLGGAYSEDLDDDLSSQASVQKILELTRANYTAFRNGEFDADIHGQMCMFPINTKSGPNGQIFGAFPSAPENDWIIPDRPQKNAGDKNSRYIFDAPGPQKIAHLYDLTKPGHDIAE